MEWMESRQNKYYSDPCRGAQEAVPEKMAFLLCTKQHRLCTTVHERRKKVHL